LQFTGFQHIVPVRVDRYYMEISIIGLPKSGKTTIFNALTRGNAETAAFAASNLIPNIGVSKVPEPRLKLLETIFKPNKVVHTEIKYVDIAHAAKSSAKGEGIYGPYLNYLSSSDALIQIVRAFENDMVPRADGGIDFKNDISNLDLELTFSDLAIIERRLSRLDESLKAAKPAERELHVHELDLLKRIKTGLEKDIPIRRQELNQEEIRNLSNYQFLTAKPMLVILNIDENQLNKTDDLIHEIRSIYTDPGVAIIMMCGKLEMELTQLEDNEAEEFRNSLGIKEMAMDKVISASYHLLGLISFFTTASSELKVWTIAAGTNAHHAAGKIHTDMEKGFIRAEVISYHDLEKCGNIADVRKHGFLRLEGKQYHVQDGDIITFLFNV
jgi:ribosome-binding ATPase